MLLLRPCPVISSFALTAVHFQMASLILDHIFFTLLSFPDLHGVRTQASQCHWVILSVHILSIAIYKNDISSRGTVETGYMIISLHEITNPDSAAGLV